MNSSESIENLAPALIAAQREFSHVGKGGRNEYDRYDYATLEDYVDAIKHVLTRHDLAVTSSVESTERLDDRTTKRGGTEYAVQVRGTIRVIHASGEWIESSFCGEGQDRADKAIYKAITGGRKYGLASLFNLATSDDPETDENVGNTPPPNKPPADEKPAEVTKKDVMAALNKRGLDDDAGQIVKYWLETIDNVTSFEQTSNDDRRKLIQSIESGNWDRDNTNGDNDDAKS